MTIMLKKMVENSNESRSWAQEQVMSMRRLRKHNSRVWVETEIETVGGKTTEAILSIPQTPAF